MNDKVSMPPVINRQRPRDSNGDPVHHYLIGVNLAVLAVCSIVILAVLAVQAVLVFICCQGVPELVFFTPITAFWALMWSVLGIQLVHEMKWGVQDLAVAICRRYRTQC